MRGVKVYLAIVSALLLVAIGFGIYVWYTVQNFQKSLEGTFEQSTEQNVTTIQGTEDTSTGTSSEVNTGNEASIAPTSIEVHSLSETQQSILKSFAEKSNTIIITQKMISCATEKVGLERITQILNGAAPTPPEARSVSICLK